MTSVATPIAVAGGGPGGVQVITPPGVRVPPRGGTYGIGALLQAGTYTTGISLDWRAQFFGVPGIFAVHTFAGEVLYPGASSTFGVYVAQGFFAHNPFDTVLNIPEASAGFGVQVWLNGVRQAELVAPGTVNLSISACGNLLEIVRGTAPLMAIPNGPLYQPDDWMSLFQAASDPFLNAQAGSGGAVATSMIPSH